MVAAGVCVHREQLSDDKHPGDGYRYTDAKCVKCGRERVIKAKVVVMFNGSLDDRKTEFARRTQARRTLAEDY